MADLTQTEWVEKLNGDDNAIILDVRTQDEVDEGKIPSAIHIDIYKGQDFIDEIETLERSKNYYVYCRAGSRSAQACAIMNQLGFENTYNLVGGFTQWRGDIEEI
jgi:rhodanese-related sulfurtransferase